MSSQPPQVNKAFSGTYTAPPPINPAMAGAPVAAPLIKSPPPLPNVAQPAAAQSVHPAPGTYAQPQFQPQFQPQAHPHPHPQPQSQPFIHTAVQPQPQPHLQPQPVYYVQQPAPSTVIVQNPGVSVYNPYYYPQPVTTTTTVQNGTTTTTYIHQPGMVVASPYVMGYSAGAAINNFCNDVSRIFNPSGTYVYRRW